MQSVNRHRVNIPAAFWRTVAVSPSRLQWLQAHGIAFIFAAGIFSGNISAQTPQLRLGTPEVLSSLGSPLWVKIPIDVTEPGEDVAASRFSLGARPLNAPVPFVDRAEISLERLSNKYFLVIRSRDSINEPAVGIVLREALASGVRSREFFLLLDPAPLSVATTVDQNRDNATTMARSDAATPLPQPGVVVLPPTIATSQPAAAVAPGPQIPPPPRTKVRRARQPRDRAAMPLAGARSTVQPTDQPSISPITGGRYSGENRRRSATPKVPLSALPSTDGGPRLKLSFGEGLTVRPATTEAERAELRMRQFTLDMDDLTSGLLERQHKITQLEKELAGLALRVSAAERLIGAAPPVVDGSPTSPAAVTLPVPPPTPEARASAADSTLTVTKSSGDRPVQSRSPFIWTWMLVGVALLAALTTAIWGIRHMLRRREQAFRITAQRAEDYVAEILSNQPPAKQAAVTRAANVAVDSPAPLTATAKPAFAKTHDYLPAEIHFELPELTPEVNETLQQLQTTDESASRVVTNLAQKPTDDATSTRMRYLQSRYQDIAILMPPLDAPQRLLRQAATVFDEGATDFAKRLLKFAAYSRPYTEEFWLALLELLYREKFASDYVVNAKWFRQYHAESPHWDEVLRIGYLLDVQEPLFGIASHWSHDEPVVGVWLPSIPSDKKPLSSLPHLNLELAK